MFKLPKMICSRCKQSCNATVRSVMNNDVICQKCNKEEKQHPLCRRAVWLEEYSAEKFCFSYKGMFPTKSWDEIKNIKDISQAEYHAIRTEIVRAAEGEQ